MYISIFTSLDDLMNYAIRVYIIFALHFILSQRYLMQYLFHLF